jgi:hypothetical protein
LSRGTKRPEETRSLLHEVASDPEQRIGSRAWTRQKGIAGDADERALVQARRVAELVRDGDETGFHGQLR